jgi:hypothetical protein
MLDFLKLGKRFDSRSKRSVSTMNVLKVTEAKDVEGKALDDLKGNIVYYLPTKEADSLITGNR